MIYFKPLRTTVCLAALFSASSAVADVTAAQVWENWKANLAIYGEDGVTIGAEDIGDGVVTVSDLTLLMQDGPTSVEANMGTITFTEQGDGTVAVTMTDSYPINIIPEDDAFVRVDVTHTGMQMIVSGEENDMTYDISADRYAFEVTEITERGEPVVDGDIMIAANNLTGTYNIRTEDIRTIVYDVSLGSLDMLVDFAEPGGDGTVTVSGKLDALRAASSLVMPLEIDPDKPEDMFADGFAVDGGYGFDAANYIFDINVDGEQAAGSVSLGAGAVNVAMDADALSYDVSTQAIAVNVQSGELPFPIDVKLAETGIGFGMPLATTEAPAPFNIALNVTDLTINDEIWAMGDPGQVLPRDPVTVRLDLSGEGKLFFDFLDPEQAAANFRRRCFYV